MTAKNLLKKIKNISENNFKIIAKEIDNKKKFPKNITKLFNRNEINLLLGYHNKIQSLTPLEECEFYFNATKYCANIRNYFLVSLGMVGSTILKFGTKKQKNDYLNDLSKGKIFSLVITEPSAGSNINQIETSYRETNNGFIINGKKKWITLGGIADKFLLLANGSHGLKLFIIDSKLKGINKTVKKDILTNKASHISNINLKNVKIKKNCLFGGKYNISSKALNYALINGRAIASISAFSMCQAALEETLIYSKKRSQFGKKIWNFQLIQKIIAESKMKIESGISFSEKAFKIKRTINLKSENYCNMLKLFASKNAQEICSDLLDVFGANGISNDYNIERYFRESKGFQFIEGTSQILTQLIALNLITSTEN